MPLILVDSVGRRVQLVDGATFWALNDDGTRTLLTISDVENLSVVNAATAKFGDYENGNYAEFESDGTLIFYGNATTWGDEKGALIGKRLESPGSDIVQDLAEGAIQFKASATYATDYVSYILQVNHDWLAASNCDFHVHWWQPSSASVNWLIGYRWQVNGASKTEAFTLVPLTDNVFTYSAGTLNQISDGSVSIVPPVNAGLSDIVQVRLYRDYTNASTLFAGAESSGADIYAVSADLHRRSDSLGSREEYTK